MEMETFLEKNNDVPFEVHINNFVYEIQQFCPHRGGKLQYGFINKRKKTITCPLHRSMFSLETGEQLSGPPCGRLKVIKHHYTKE